MNTSGIRLLLRRMKRRRTGKQDQPQAHLAEQLKRRT
jgi:hypothetical protein